jgi:hypothetical protein
MSRWWLVALAVLLVVACDSQGTTVSLTELPDVSGQVDSGVETDGTETPDIAVSPDQFVLPELVFDVLPDTPFVECEPGTGCFLDPCIENSDCQSGWCVEHMGEAVCTMPCQEECPPGWSCQQVSGGNPDVVYICVSDVSNLCKPCRTGDNCKSPGGNEDVCLDYGAEGSFCGSICASDDDCPWGFSCADSKTVDGIDTRQCLSDAGVCPCTGKSVKLALWTGCAVTNEFGVCPGKRVCSDGGLTDCDALVPAPETCNGLDDDCDGDVDEPNVFEGDFVNPCDDGNPCTKDTCLGEAGCAHDVLSEGECADGDACTIGDHCDAGVCTGLPIICDDSNPCTDDFCDGLGGCTNEFNLAACDDGDPCTVNDQCSQGECSGFAVACDCQSDSDCAALEDGDLCNGTLICQKNKLPYQCIVAPATVVTCPAPVGPDGVCVKAACDPLTGNCSLAADHEGFACDDENPCTVGDACAGGECVGGVAVVCDDGNGCTDDACDPDDGCVYLPNSGPCDDGNACTSGDHCGGGLCLYDAVVDCDDGDPCTNDSCTPQGGCVYTQNTAPCDDQNVCTTGDQCAQGQCVGTVPVVCNDNNGCTDDSCDAQTGCVFAPNVAPCDDQNPCTLNDLCTGGMCQGSGALDCDDGNPCTNDACDGAKGCVHKSNTAPCDDGSACTVGDLCAQGACVGGAPLVCNDNNGCTDDSCDDDAGCQFVPNEADCNDGNLCTLADKCSQGTCQGTQAVNCNDDNLCTTDSCTPLQGCIHTFNSAPCDDQDACTIGEKCELGQCASGGQLNCNDGNVCTLDSCDAKVGCEFVPTAGACSDTNACTVGDACLDGECAAGEPLNCDDNNPCTLDTCHPADGCEYTAIDGACDDKDQCTTVDACVEGVCVGSVPLECLDSNPCTNDGCNAQTGCTFIANDAFCDDGDACTTLDQCSQGSCLGGPALSCDDSKECTTDSCDSDSGCVFTPVEDGTACTQNGGVVCASGTCVEYQPGSQIFTYTGGAQTFTVPPGVSKVRVAVVGGGGGGAGSHYGGGGSGYVLYGSYDVAGTVTVTVGSGGNGGISGTNDAPGSKGGTSSFGGHLSASGGNGGNTNGPGGGHGGSGGGGAGNSGCAGKGGAGGSAGQGGCSYPGGSGGHFDNFNAMQFKSLTAGAGGAAGTSSHSGGGGAGGLLIDGAGPAAGNGGESWSGKGGMGYGAGGGAGGYNGSRPTGGKGAPGVIYVEW